MFAIVNLLTSVIIFCLTVNVCFGSEIADQGVKYPDPNRWQKAINEFEQWDDKNTYPEDAVLFVGSSSIVVWKTAKSFPELPVINRGFGGSVVADSVFYADRIILPYKPRVVVFYAGDNDVAGNIPADMVHQDFIRLTEIIHKELPRTEIICLPVKPSPARWGFWPQMQAVNKLNLQFAQKTDYVTFIDTAEVLLKVDGTPDASLYYDGLHMNDKGYAIWNRVVRPVLRERYRISEKLKVKN